MTFRDEAAQVMARAVCDVIAGGPCLSDDERCGRPPCSIENCKMVQMIMPALDALATLAAAQGVKVVGRHATPEQVIEFWRITPEQAEVLKTNLGNLKWLAMFDAARCLLQEDKPTGGNGT